MRRRPTIPTPAIRSSGLAVDATELYSEIARGSRPADFEIAAYFRRRGLRDYSARGQIAELVYAALRRAPYYDAVLAGATDARIIPAGASDRLTPFLAALDAPGGFGSRQRVIEAFGSLHDARRGLEDLAAWYEAHASLDFIGDDGPSRFAALHAFPLWVVEELEATIPPDELACLLDGLGQAPPLTIRVNTFKTSLEDLETRLVADGFRTMRGALSPVALFVDRSGDVFATPAFREGLFEVQDEGSQVVSMLVGARRSTRVVDLCAGSGGKTLHLGAIMGGRGDVFAYDTDSKRLSNMTRRLRRSGLQNVRVLHDADELAAFQARIGAVDRVLVDAPCTGLGAVRRAPDIKLRVTPELATLMARKQLEVLERAATLTKRGGRVVYATCSILPAENESIVREFLDRFRDFALVPVSGVLPDDAPSALRSAVLDRDVLFLTPHSHGTDAFFAAVFERIADAT